MTPDASKGMSIAVTIAMVYAVFGAVWVLAGDTLLAALVEDRATMTMIQTWKGWAFVALSAGLIYVVGSRLLAAVEESERRYRLLFADSPEALVLYDPERLAVVEANAAAARLFGYEVQDIQGMRVADLLTDGGGEALRRELPRLRAKGGGSGLWQVRCRDGRVLDVATHGQEVRVTGRTLRLVLLMDVTARLRAEIQLLRTLDDLAAANGRVRELSHAISHDLQEPLRQISGFVQLLQRRYQGKLDDEAEQFIGFAVEGTGRLKALIRDVERFAIETAAQPVAVDANRVAAGVVDSLKPQIEDAGATVTVAPLPTVSADPEKLAVVFHALLDNAVKFRRLDVPCQVSVSAERHPGGAVFQVRDNGLGIEPEYIDSIFSLFRRLHTRDRIPGNGTGLALARKLVEAHGGRIWVESVAGGGSIFSFTLPEP
ncbi:ATP-binding protein [Magnetospirillum sp. UT-4]|uniref:sensor histidine kinase n=1 Tax=Magnetospirillum sp. UT-4 TaxID=2681467 RepID=UPI0013821506|nr:ATP-binding protein [Magnetospirillum sp. UT-4]CAA7620081.1 Bacteriophytochrome (Light-regulated signal transduction histidine kinase) [Magnetospirillum sp. UT-4]